VVAMGGHSLRSSGCTGFTACSDGAARLHAEKGTTAPAGGSAVSGRARQREDAHVTQYAVHGTVLRRSAGMSSVQPTHIP
jgi:hypothetical protein